MTGDATMDLTPRSRFLNVTAICRGIPTIGIAVMVLSAIGHFNAAQSAAPIVYPAKGQSLEQQSSDEGACRVWAKQQTGFDPSQAPPPDGSAPTGPTGEVVRGAARGAALGAVGGAIGGDAGKGAAIGAGVGATAGLMRRGQSRRQAENAQQQAQAQHAAQQDLYMRAFGACMQGRGYAIK
jgi:hypothetical protein